MSEERKALHATAYSAGQMWPLSGIPLADCKRIWFEQGVVLGMREEIPTLLKELGLYNTVENAEALEYHVLRATKRAFEFGMDTVIKAFGDYLEYGQPEKKEENNGAT